MIIWLPVLWIATGICLFAGAHFLHAGQSRENARLFFAFGCLCLAVTAYIGATALLQAPVAGRASASLERLHVALLCVIYPVGFWFISMYSHLRRWQPWVIASSVVFGTLLVFNLTGSHSLLLANVRPLAPMVLPWGERVAQITGTSTALAPVFYAATLATFLWAFWRCLALWKTGQTKRAWPLVAYLVLQVLATVYAEYYTLYPQPVLSWDALPFLVLVLLLSRTLNLELRGYAIALDISNTSLRAEVELRTQAEARLRAMAYHDPISRLPNRHALADWLDTLLRAKPQQHGALMVVDPQRFAIINHALGHTVGDRLIRELGARLFRVAARDGFVARLSGDEFAVGLALPAAADAATASREALDTAGRLLQALVEPLQVGTHTLTLSAHIGVAMFHRADAGSETLLREAYVALHAAKQSGHAEPALFAESMQARAERKLRLETDLHAAIEGNQLSLVYQPQVDRTGRLVGAEALLRWDHPALGDIGPDEFIHIAEQSGQMPALGRAVLRMACATLATLPPRTPFRLAVNISPWQLFLADFLSTVQAVIRNAAIEPTRLTLELTETAFIHDIPDAVTKLQALDAMGIHVSIDDFGTGYAAIALLKAFPVHALKIDQAFVRDMSTTAPDRFIAAMIALGNAMHLQVVAEGVEREEQRAALIAMGCEVFQGYLISRPIPATTLAEWMR